MRLNKKLLVALLVLAASKAPAATVDHEVKYRLAIMQDDQLIHRIRHQAFNFRMEIVNDTDGVKSETVKNGHPFVTAVKGERYSVRLYNPLPVRVAVNLTVDGLNSITGKPSGIADGEKWMIDPYSSITIPGWQVSDGEARRFFFTDKPKSYAKWREDVTGQNLSANCGVIGAAFFWSQAELNEYYDENPLYRYSDSRPRAEKKSLFDMPSNSVGGAVPAPEAEGAMQKDVEADTSAAAPAEQAGTGMGEGESHPTIQVAFNYDTGMYSLDQALVVYYDFDQTPSPNPFPSLGYAPQIP